MKTIKLNRKQINTLIEIQSHFKDCDEFVIKEENLSGIGPTVSVTFDLFPKRDIRGSTKIDLTDIGTW